MASRRELYRIIDANFNRSREGLRVCEDIARFILSSPALSKDLKSLRHSISSIIKSSRGFSVLLLESRDTGCDVGRQPDFSIEVPRQKAKDIFSANIERVKESLRVLEEFLKLTDLKSSAKMQRIRFKAYEIEKKAVIRLSGPKYSGKGGL